jgi:hypothetical protein
VAGTGVALLVNQVCPARDDRGTPTPGEMPRAVHCRVLAGGALSLHTDEVLAIGEAGSGARRKLIGHMKGMIVGAAGADGESR